MLENKAANKQVLVILGSPRKKGNSSTLAARLSRGAKSAGAEVETLRGLGRCYKSLTLPRVLLDRKCGGASSLRLLRRRVCMFSTYLDSIVHVHGLGGHCV